jgi:uncharacterized membrane protein YtjA (UPF0391 family)
VAWSLLSVDHSTVARVDVARFRESQVAMLHWATIFVVVASVAAILGFGGIAGEGAGVARTLFFVFLAVAVMSVLLGRRAA